MERSLPHRAFFRRWNDIHLFLFLGFLFLAENERHSQPDNNREQYSRQKIENGIIRACYKRPVPTEKIQQAVNNIETKVFSLEEKEIPSSVVGELVMDELKDLDEVAYVRFASVYREFKDVNTFMDELKKILDKEEK